MKLKDFLSLFEGGTDVTIEAVQGGYKPMLHMTSTVETLSWMVNENTLDAEIEHITKYEDELVIRVKFFPEEEKHENSDEEETNS